MPNQNRIAGILDYPKLLNLLKTGYPDLWSETALTWQTYKNPAGRAINRISVEKSTVIANAAAIAIPLQSGNKTYSAYRVQDVITSPAARGKGLFSKLLHLLNEDIRRDDNLPNITFPNENSHRFFIRNGWQILGRVPFWEKTVSKLPKLKIDDQVKWKPLIKFGHTEKDIFESYQRHFDFSVNFESEYLNWRFFLNPNSTYDAFRLTFGSDSAVIVLKRYQDEPNDIFRGHICLLAMTNLDPAFFENILYFAEHYFYTRGCKVASQWYPVESEFAETLEEFGYLNNKELERYVLIDQNLSEPKFDLQMFYSDVY